MTPRTRPLLALALVLAGLFTACSGGDTTIFTGDPDVETGITVTGTGEASAPPDMAVLTLGVEVTASTIADARERAAQAADRLIASARANGVTDRDIQTASFNISPVYDYSRPGQPTITAYTVSNLLTVRIRNLDRLGKAIDDAVAAAGDAARVHGLQFAFSEPETLLETARKNAVEDARKRAETYAAAAGVRLGTVVAISETVSGGPVPLAAPRTGAVDATTPIEPGESTVSVTVSVRYALEP